MPCGPRWRSWATRLVSIARRRGWSWSRLDKLVEMDDPSEDPRRQYIGPPRDGRASRHYRRAKLWTRSRAASRVAPPAAARSAIQPKPCQAAIHSGPAEAGDQRGEGWRTSSPASSISPAAMAAPRFPSPGQRWPIREPEIGRDAADQRVAIERTGGERSASASRRSRVKGPGGIGAATGPAHRSPALFGRSPRHPLARSAEPAGTDQRRDPEFCAERQRSPMRLRNKESRCRKRPGSAVGQSQAPDVRIAALDQPRAEKAVDAVILAKMAGQCPQVAVGGDPFGRGADLIGRRSPAARPARQRRAALRSAPALLGLERAGAIDQSAARPEHVDRGAQQIAPEPRQAGRHLRAV